MKPLVPYLRQSRAKEKTISIEDQRRDIAVWAKANGFRPSSRATTARRSVRGER